RQDERGGAGRRKKPPGGRHPHALEERAPLAWRRPQPISTIVESHQRSPYPAGMATSLLARNPAAAHVLGLLSALAGAEIHTREVARRTRHDVHSAQLALTQLLREGFVRSRRLGNLRLWSVDPNSPDA